MAIGGVGPGQDRATLALTRRSLHAVAETLLAGPQWRRTGTIRLTVVPGGFATLAQPRVAVVEDRLVLDERGLSFPLEGTLGHLAAAAGLDFGPPVGVYASGSGAQPDDRVTVDPHAAEVIAGAFGVGDRALRLFASRAVRGQGVDRDAPVPVLWPEHFDLGITLDEVNYGVSPGDDQVGEPYAYVGPWRTKTGPFWNQPFGAARTLDVLADEEGLVTFFDGGRVLSAR